MASKNRKTLEACKAHFEAIGEKEKAAYYAGLLDDDSKSAPQTSVSPKPAPRKRAPRPSTPATEETSGPAKPAKKPEPKKAPKKTETDDKKED